MYRIWDVFECWIFLFNPISAILTIVEISEMLEEMHVWEISCTSDHSEKQETVSLCENTMIFDFSFRWPMTAQRPVRQVRRKRSKRETMTTKSECPSFSEARLIQRLSWTWAELRVIVKRMCVFGLLFVCIFASFGQCSQKYSKTLSVLLNVRLKCHS